MPHRTPRSRVLQKVAERTRRSRGLAPRGRAGVLPLAAVNTCASVHAGCGAHPAAQPDRQLAMAADEEAWKRWADPDAEAVQERA